MLTLQILSFKLAICRLEKNSAIPDWTLKSNQFFSVTQTEDELSIVCLESDVQETIKSEKGWRAFKVVGTLDF